MLMSVITIHVLAPVVRSTTPAENYRTLRYSPATFPGFVRGDHSRGPDVAVPHRHSVAPRESPVPTGVTRALARDTGGGGLHGRHCSGRPALAERVLPQLAQPVAH